MAGSMTYEQLQQAIADSYPQLSRRLQQIATYALDNPNEMALDTIAVVAKRADVQPSSLIRFAKAFGFSGYSEMQKVFRLRLTDAIPDYKERLRSFSGPPGKTQTRDLSQLLAEFVEADTVGLQWLRESCGPQHLDKALELMVGARTIYLLAHRRSFPVCAYLSYALSQLGVKNVLIDGVGGMFFQQARHVDVDDVLLAVSSKAYSTDVLEVVEQSAERGVPVIAITDGPLSPLVSHATVTLEVKDVPVHDFRSLAAQMTLAITLVVGVGRRLEAERRKREARAKGKNSRRR